MESLNLNFKTIYASLLAATAWFAIILQFNLFETRLLNFLSYFTILSNLFIAVSITISTVKPKSKIGAFLSSLSAHSALVLYIFIVALVYNLVLRGLWKQTGWQIVSDNLLHVAIPVLYIVYWLLFVPKIILKWRAVFSWLYIPFIYMIYTFLRGELTCWYPYPFVNVTKLGYGKVLINTVVLIFVFFVIGLLVNGINRLLCKKEKNSTIND